MCLYLLGRPAGAPEPGSAPALQGRFMRRRTPSRRNLADGLAEAECLRDPAVRHAHDVDAVHPLVGAVPEAIGPHDRRAVARHDHLLRGELRGGVVDEGRPPLRTGFASDDPLPARRGLDALHDAVLGDQIGQEGRITLGERAVETVDDFGGAAHGHDASSNKIDQSIYLLQI